MSILKKIIQPGDCIMAFGIPTSRTEFMRSAKPQGITEQITWEQYDRQFVRFYHETMAAMPEDVPVHIVTELTLERFRQVLSGEQTVMILFSHWDEDRVEFFDAFQPVDDIVTHIPESFVGVFDLCVCHPWSLKEAIKQKRPDCFVRWANKRVTPGYWLYYYVTFFRLLRDNGNLTYLRAVEETARLMLLYKPAFHKGGLTL